MEERIKDFKIEINVWQNKELGLWYLENRAFDEEENLVEAFLSVCDNDGNDFNLGDLEESNKGKDCLDNDYIEVTVDDVEWTHVERMIGYSCKPNDDFISASHYLSSENRK